MRALLGDRIDHVGNWGYLQLVGVDRGRVGDHSHALRINRGRRHSNGFKDFKVRMWHAMSRVSDVYCN